VRVGDETACTSSAAVSVAALCQPNPLVGKENRRVFFRALLYDMEDDADDAKLRTGDDDEEEVLLSHELKTLVSKEARASVERTETRKALSYAVARPSIEASTAVVTATAATSAIEVEEVEGATFVESLAIEQVASCGD